jgi:hypothetical protein
MYSFRILMAAATCLALFADRPAFAAPPANDNFASAITIGATPYTHSTTTLESTNEAGEPTLGCGGSNSIWYKYTAPSTGTVIADTFGSGFDTELRAYSGATLETLNLMACNDDYSGLASWMPFAVQAGQTYYIRLAGYSGSRGSSTLHLSSVIAPEHTECPLIGASSGCHTLITAQNDGTYVQDADTNQPTYTAPYHGRLMGVQNDSGEPLCEMTLYGTNAFNFTTFGICSSTVVPHPAMCPFGDTEYEGPGVSFDKVTNNLGTVSFSPCIPDGSSSYFGIDGYFGTIYACAGDEVCGPDNDMDGLINDVDNCPSNANPDQADLDDDAQGDVCDSVDNTVTLKGSIKVKTDGKQAVVKGLIFQSETIVDSPDVSGGIELAVYDNAFTNFGVSFSAAECIATEKKITCVTLDGLSSLKIPLGGLTRGKVPYKLKTKDMDSTLPPNFLGPLAIQIIDTATQIQRSGTSSTECTTKPNMIVCK